MRDSLCCSASFSLFLFCSLRSPFLFKVLPYESPVPLMSREGYRFALKLSCISRGTIAKEESFLPHHTAWSVSSFSFSLVPDLGPFRYTKAYQMSSPLPAMWKSGQRQILLHEAGKNERLLLTKDNKSTCKKTIFITTRVVKVKSGIKIYFSQWGPNTSYPITFVVVDEVNGEGCAKKYLSMWLSIKLHEFPRVTFCSLHAVLLMEYNLPFLALKIWCW